MANKKSTTAKEPELKHSPKVVLRTYQASDYDQVEFLYRSTTVPLIYESIRSKLWAPITWLVWFTGFTLLLVTVPKAVVYLFGEIPGWADTILRILTTFVWAVVGFAAIFISCDRVELQNRVDEALANDLRDPELYYLNFTLDKDGNKVRKPKEEQVPSHFWVLTLDDEVCGMIGLSCNSEDVLDQRPVMPVAWKQFTVAVLELLRLPVPAMLEKGFVPEKKFVFAHKQIPKTASITRWAIRGELQTCGFSTLLINRAITWASEHDINRVYAMTDECCMAAEQILVKRHNFVIMKRFNLNYFGQYRKLFGCRVVEWMEKNGEKTRKVFSKSKTSK
ncbi:hypothetical protein EDC94DRAFT_192056 [Helicostylum pulchrum]|uniref:N-acetyltransferase domain-containing protein n=1 Tax=Helicostylum pulchrum TaxID=562976 RepID=A0ABP9XRU1_9FUNG|nr:hypothetical protein EDC94DRAFT_192056 [Helicostylum pulchrum]